MIFHNFATPMRNRVASLRTVLPHNEGLPKKRRRTSIFDLFASSPAPEIRPSISSRQDYRLLRTTEERVEKAIQLFRTEIL